MKGLIPLLTFLTICSFTFGQNTVSYEIHPGSNYNLDQLKSALEMCDLTRYVLPDSHVNLEFDDGSVVEILSATEHEEKGIKIDRSLINNSDNELMNTFSIHPKGYILEHVKKWTKEELAKRMAK